MNSKNKIYSNNVSIILLFIVILITFTIGVFLINLSLATSIIGVFFILIPLSKVNNIIFIDDYLHIISPFLIPKKIKFSKFTKIKCESVGLGRSSDHMVYIYYLQNEKTKKSILNNFRLLHYGIEKLITLLDTLDVEKIDVTSFKILGIDYCDGKFIRI